MTSSSLAFIKADKVHTQPVNEAGDSAIIAIVDDGLDLMHSAFRDKENNTRIIQFWDQTDSNKIPAKCGVKFGRVYNSEQINHFIKTNSLPSHLSSTHGTMVTSIAAGRKPPSDVTGEHLFAGGVAPNANIIFVKPVKKSTVENPFSLGASVAHIAALSFIDCIAKERGLPVVVNLSIGMNGGAHDGSTLLENAIEQFTAHGTRPGRIVVKAAGNERGRSAHALLQLGANEKEMLTWNSRTVNRSEDKIEVWFKAADKFDFRLHQPAEPDSGSSNVLSLANPEVDEFLPNGNRCYMTYVHLRANNGDSQILITISPGNISNIAGGDWQLEIISGEKLPSGGTLNAWLERDTIRPIKFKDNTSDTSTITIPGTCQSVITVGAASSSAPIETYDHSSEGPTRDGRKKPELIAPGIQIHAARAGTLHQTISNSGTSFAAPHVSGAIALLLSHRQKKDPSSQLNSAQIRAALIQTTQGFDGKWRKRKGYGMLNIKAAMDWFL